MASQPNGRKKHAFFDEHRIIAEDLVHSQTEKRYFCFEKDEEGNGILTVRFTKSRGQCC